MVTSASLSIVTVKSPPLFSSSLYHSLSRLPMTFFQNRPCAFNRRFCISKSPTHNFSHHIPCIFVWVGFHPKSPKFVYLGFPTIKGSYDPIYQVIVKYGV